MAGKFIGQPIEAFTEKVVDKYVNSKTNEVLGNISAVTQDVVDVAGKATILVLSKAWIGLGLRKPAKTEREEYGNNPKPTTQRVQSASGPVLDRFEYERLYSLQLGEFFMPLSQTFRLRAKKRMKTSALIDGIDIIQQVRKEAKTITCTIRISLRERQTNLQIVDVDQQVQKLAWFLAELYETNAVFEVSNDMINNTFGVTHAIMEEYDFTPRIGMGTYTFEFALTEVKYGDNVLTLDLSEVDSAIPREITD